MKYKRQRTKVSKYISYTDDKSQKTPQALPTLKKRALWAAMLILVMFALTRVYSGSGDFVKKLFTLNTIPFDIGKSELLSAAGNYISEFCFGYPEAENDKGDKVYAVSKQQPDISAPVGASPAKKETAEETRFAPIMPCRGVLSSPFGEREHPLTGEDSFHNGIDLALEEGDEIWACFDGIVIKSEYNDYSGNYIIIEHQKGYTSSYAHMSRLDVQAGQSVKKGDVIGLAGSTGGATGPHLHFEIRMGGSPLDPEILTRNNE